MVRILDYKGIQQPMVTSAKRSPIFGAMACFLAGLGFSTPSIAVASPRVQFTLVCAALVITLFGLILGVFGTALRCRPVWLSWVATACNLALLVMLLLPIVLRG